MDKTAAMSATIEWFEKDIIPKVIERVKKKGAKYDCVWSSLENCYFLSDMFSVDIIFKENNETKDCILHLILKSPPLVKESSQRALDNKLYANEILFYEKFSENSTKYPLFFYGTSDDIERTVLVMENVSGRGFVMCQQLYDIPFTYVIAAVREIGRFHGVSYTMKEAHPEKMRKIVEKIQVTRFIPGGRLHRIIEVVAMRPVEWLRKGNYDPVFCSKMEQYLGDAFNTIMLDGLRPVEPLAVLIHGDVTRGNVLFNETSKEMQAMLIDFGTICYTSPAIDLSTLLFLNTSSEDRRYRFDEIFKAYHDSLLESLRDGGIQDLAKYSMMNMLDDYRRRAAWGYIISLFFLPVLCGYCDASESADKGDIVDTDFEDISRKMKAGGGDAMSQKFADTLLELRDTGCLDHVLL